MMDMINSSRQDHDPLVWQSTGQPEGLPSIYVYLERLGREPSRSEEVLVAGDRLSRFIKRNLVHPYAENIRNPYTHTLNRIWGEIVPSRIKPSTHLFEVGYKLLDNAPEPFLRIPLRLINPDTKDLADIQELLECLRSAVESLERPKTLPIPPDLRHGYTLIVLEALFVGWIHERGLVEVVAAAASQPLFELRALTDCD